MTPKKQFQQALLCDTAKDMRQHLRKLAQPIIETCWDTGDIQTLFSDSPLVGTDANQVNPTPNHSGLCMSLDLSTLALIVASWCDLDDLTMDARSRIKLSIMHPDVHSRKDSSGKSKTGYTFGRPHNLEDDYLTGLIDQAEKSGGIFMETRMEYTLKNTLSLVLITELMAADGTLGTDCIVEIVNDHMSGELGPFQSALTAYNEGDRLTLDDHGGYDSSMGLWQHYDNHYGFIYNRLEDAGTPFDAPAAAPSALTLPDDSQATILDAVLSAAGMPDIKTMVSKINSSTADMSAATLKISELETKLKQTAAAAIAVSPVTAKADASGAIPSGKVVTKNAAEVFGITGAAKSQFDFNVPVWEWDGVHPHVPVIDPSYIFRPEELLRGLYALLTNQRAYFYGHTGTGKTTLIEQMAARLLWPFMRVNFDSEITRMDLIGRDTLSTEGGVTVSKFEDGILPQAMSGPYILCCDEVDFVRPDVAYVMQRALEGNGLLLTEDGGRVIEAHPMFRMFATGNTQGQGDEHGMYAGARPQSMAFLDRFTVWCQVDYLGANDRKKLIKAKVPSLTDTQLELVCQYTKEHLEAFKSAKVMQPLSPRGMISLAQAVGMFVSMAEDGAEGVAIKRAFGTTILDRATSTDHAVMRGIVDRLV